MVVGDGGWRFGGSGGGGGYEYVPVVALPLPGRPPSPVCRGSQASKPTSSSTSNHNHHKLLADISRRFHSRGVSPFWLTTVYMLSQIPDHSNKHVSQILDPQQPPHPPLTITGAPINQPPKKKEKNRRKKTRTADLAWRANKAEFTTCRRTDTCLASMRILSSCTIRRGTYLAVPGANESIYPQNFRSSGSGDVRNA
jgi:hypothetical protein